MSRCQRFARRAADGVIDWLVLMGGSSSRLGTDKSSMVLAGRTLTERAVRCVGEVDPLGSVRTVGPDRSGGPAAAVASMLAELTGTYVGVLAVDMPFATEALDAVVSRVRRDFTDESIDAWVPVGADDRPQWLCAVYRLASLRESAGRRDHWEGAPFHALVGGLMRSLVPVQAPVSLLDIDTPEDLRQAEAIAERLGANQAKGSEHRDG